MNQSNHEKTLSAVFVETCFLLGAIMVTVAGAVIIPWMMGRLDMQNVSARAALIWAFQFGLGGAIHMVFMPVARFMFNMTVRIYHYPAIFIGLCAFVYTASVLKTSHMFVDALWFFFVPPVMAFVMMMIKNQRGTATPVLKK